MDQLRITFRELEIDYLNAQKSAVEKELKKITETLRVIECLLEKINGQIQSAVQNPCDSD